MPATGISSRFASSIAFTFEDGPATATSRIAVARPIAVIGSIAGCAFVRTVGTGFADGDVVDAGIAPPPHAAPTTSKKTRT